MSTRITKSQNIILAGILTVLLLATGAQWTAAQEEDPAQVRERQELRDPKQDPQGDAVRDRIRERIENEPQLQTQERQQLREHLGECEKLGLDDATLKALFNEDRPLRAQLRHQERVLTMAQEGLPIEPMVDKLQEGQRKNVADQALERVCTRMENHVRTANRVMEQARAEGLSSGDPQVERQLTRGIAMDMWRGLEEGDMTQLREQARKRLQEHDCSTTDLAAAAETATQLHEMGVDPKRAVNMAGEALQRGYAAREIRQISWMVMAAHGRGGAPDDVLDRVEDGLRSHEQMGEMVQHMWQRGWMGPGDEHGGRGGHSPVDDVIGGPGGHQGEGGHGPGGPDDMGGSSAPDGHGGGSGGSGGGGGGQGGGGHHES